MYPGRQIHTGHPYTGSKLALYLYTINDVTSDILDVKSIITVPLTGETRSRVILVSLWEPGEKVNELRKSLVYGVVRN